MTTAALEDLLISTASKKTRQAPARKYPPLASLLSPKLRAEAAAATLDGEPLFPSLQKFAVRVVAKKGDKASG